MNLNELFAARGNEILGLENSEGAIHPNNHVNMAQSSNDTIPTATRLAVLSELHALMKAGNELLNAFEAKALAFSEFVKVGRTHLQDAVPVTLGQEFGAYASALRRCLERIDDARHELCQLGIGGTATGSGINTHPDFTEKMCEVLSEMTGEALSPAENRFETTHSHSALLSVSSSLRSLATELLRICNDLRLLASGPRAGFGEIFLPEVQPGSSIMPGKVNPSILECMSMICVQVLGLDHAVALSAQQGQLELNWYTPLMMWDLTHMVSILAKGMTMTKEKCVTGIEAKPENMAAHLERSTALATALAPHMGYDKVAKLVKEAQEKGVSFISLVPKEFKSLLNAQSMTGPNLGE